MAELWIHWYLLPLGMGIACVYSSTGISGASFWMLVYVVGLRMDPRLAFWLALLSMLFGSLGGLFAHRRAGSIHWPVARRLATVAVPAAVVGAVLAAWTPVRWLLLAFGGFLLLQAARLTWDSRPAREDGVPLASPGEPFGLAGLGGFLTGLISVGTGEILLPRMLRRADLPRPVDAAGTTLAIVFADSLVAALLRLRPELVAVLAERRLYVVSILIWVVPGVLIGSQLGPWLTRRLGPRTMRRYAAVLLLGVGGLMAARALMVP